MWGKNSKRLGIDHDHTTGQVRGLLCDNCNPALGSFKDNIETLQKAIDYLKEGKNSKRYIREKNISEKI
jgi:hypothetical protein